MQYILDMSSPRTRWHEAAEAVGGTVEDAGAGHLVALRVDGCVFEAGTTTGGPNPMTWLASEAPGSAGLRLAVSQQDDFPFREAFAIDSGDPEFDDRFSIKTNDAPFARLWLDDEVRGGIAEASRDYHFLLERGRCRAWRFAEESQPEELANVLRALAKLSQRGQALRREWELLAEHLGGKLVARAGADKAEGTMSIHVKLPQVTVIVDAFYGALARKRAGRGLFTRVRCARRSLHRDRYAIHDADGRRALRPRLPVSLRPLTVDHAALSQRYRVECEDLERAAERLSEKLCDRIMDARPEIIIADPEHVTVFFLGYESDPERVCAGIEITESLAVDLTPEGLAGPYR